MTDEELRRIYDEACSTAGGYIHPRPAALRAVFLAGAREERERAILEHDNSACAAEIADLKKRIEVAHAEGFADGARAQREMKPTAEMLAMDFEVCTVSHPFETSMCLCDRNKRSLFLAMQRAAPLAGEEK